MTKRTWCFKFITTLLISGLAACGGSGGGGGGGGGGIPTATNAAISPPPTTPVTITTTGGTTSQTNQSIGANSFQASNGALTDASTASGVVSAAADNGGTRETLGQIVRRHAEKLKDHQSAVNQGSVTSAVQVQTQPCSGGGTMTVAFDDANNSATEVFVQCNQGGTVTHGTLASSNVGVVQNLGPTAGSPYNINVTAAFSIDLSITTTSPTASSVVTQGSFTFAAGFSGNMQATANGVEPGVPNRVQLSLSGASLLSASITTNGNANVTVRERLSDFNFSVDDNDVAGKTTISGGYTYASTIIGGAVTVNATQPVMFQPQSASHPTSGQVTITSSGSPGKIVLTVISSPFAGVEVDVYANAADAMFTNTANLTWAQVDAL